MMQRYKKLNHVSRLLLLGVAVLTVLILFYIGAGYFIYLEVMNTYVSNYLALEAAGFEQIIASPGAFSDRLLLIISFIPLVGAGLILPIFLKAAFEIKELSESLASLINKDV